MFLPVILSGGSGERLWPVSLPSFPKPFIAMPDGNSLLQKAFLRASSLDNISEILTITNSEHYFSTKNQYKTISCSDIKTSYILEPFARNTAPAIAIAAHYAKIMYGEDTVVLILPADQLIENTNNFSISVKEAKELAKKNHIVTFGVIPTRAETGFGYINISENHIENFPNSYLVKNFIEKPILSNAENYIKDRNFLWNAGIFCFKAGIFLHELEKYSPEVMLAIKITADGVDWKKATQEYIELDSKKFARVPNISFDYAVLEKSDKVAVCKCDIGWSDIGSWNALGDLTMPDTNGNRIKGEAYTHSSSDCIIQSSSDSLIATVGVKDLIIINTPDSLLVADKNKAQEIKDIVAEIKEKNYLPSKRHSTFFRSWGKYTIIEEGVGFKIKRIEILPHHSISLQKHKHRSEHWVVISGVASVQNNYNFFNLLPSQSTYIQAKHKHKLSNDSDELLIIIEVQCGSYLGEDDIIRFDNDPIELKDFA